MRKSVALFALLAACEGYPDQNEMQQEDAQASFEHWLDLLVAGKMAEAVQMMTQSYKSQWTYDRLAEGDPAALEWRTKLKGNARTDIDLWHGEAEKATAKGRVPTLPRTVLADPSLNALLVGYLKDAALEVRYEFTRVKIVKVSADELGVSILVHSSRGEPEMYQLVIEGGMWKLDHHKKKEPR